MPEKWLSAKETEERTSIPSGTIKRYIRLHGFIEHYRYNGQYFISESSLEVLQTIRSMYNDKKNTDYINLHFKYEQLKVEYEEIKQKKVVHEDKHALTEEEINIINIRDNRFLHFSEIVRKKREERKKKEKKTFWPVLLSLFKRKKRY